MILDEDGKLLSTPIWVDFMHIDWEKRLRLDVPGTRRDLTTLRIELAEGKRIVVYQEDADEHGAIDDLVAVGTLRFDPDEARWVAIVDWDLVRHVSELSADEAEQYGRYRPQG
jgi:hypothetical protein